MPGNKQWIIKHAPTAKHPILGTDIELQDGAVPEPNDGEFLVKVVVISVDPYIRLHMDIAINAYTSQPAPFPRVGDTECVGRIVKSRNSNWQEGSLVRGRFGWQEYAVSNGDRCEFVPSNIKSTLSLGALGMPGQTAYFGLLEVGNPNEGETVVVSAAAGAVGNIVGQIAKLKGCRVVGVAGGAEKVQHLKSLGFDEAIDYKGKSLKQLEEALSAAAPKGIDVYFENTGGDVTRAVVPLLNAKARIAICGQASTYGETATTDVPLITVLLKRLRVEGFFVNEWMEWSTDAAANCTKHFNDTLRWIVEGKIQTPEDISNGIDSVYEAFMELFNQSISGKSNVGKKLVVVADDPSLHTRNSL